MTRIPQIDLIKGIAIILVLLHHTFDRSIVVAALSQITSFFWFMPLKMTASPMALGINTIISLSIAQAVPVFLVVMGINSLTSKPNVPKRLKRLLIPFGVIFVISLIYGLYNGIYYMGWKTFFGELPVTGPGNYFIPLVVEYTLIAPLVYTIYKRSPKLTLLGFFIINLLFDIIFLCMNWSVYYHDTCIFRGIFAIGLGMYIYEYGFNKYLLLGTLISVFLLVLSPYHVLYGLGDWNVLTFFYPAAIVSILLRVSKRFRVLEEIGKASYHIYLIQMLYFGWGLSISKNINVNNILSFGPIFIMLDLILTVGLGVVFELVEYRCIRLINLATSI